MKSMKKGIVLLLVILTLAAMMFALASCKEEPNNEHKHNYVAEVVSPTCTQKGYTKHTCECGDSYTDTETAMVAHSMTQVEAKPATCSAEGYSAYSVCSVCGHKEGESVIPALPHTYESTYTYPTLDTAGSRTSVCKVCNYTKTVTIDALSATLPNLAKSLAQMIKLSAATIEISEGSELVYVSELNDYTEDTGLKGVVFVEIAEAYIDAEGLNGHLKVKIGMAEAEIDGSVAVENVVPNKDNAEFLELYVYLNGDVVSLEFNDEELSVNVSEKLFGVVAQMFGMEDYEDVLEVASLTQNVAKLIPLAEKAITSATKQITTVSPEYIKHIEALLGEELVVKTIDADGNTVYTLNTAGLKKLLEEIDGKTVAEYLETVYGKDVVGALASFLKTLPDKTVKEIANAAVDFAEGAEVEIGEVYMIIDLYVYFATSQSFNIESEIAERYDMTLADVLAELAGVEGEDKAEFIASMKEDLTEAAEVIETVTFEKILGPLLGFEMDAEEGAFDAIYEAIDMMGDVIALEVTVDAEGKIIAMNLETEAGTLDYEVDGENTVMNLVMANGVEITVTTNANGATAVISQDGEIASSVSLTYTETSLAYEITDGENTMLKLEIELNDQADKIISASLEINDYIYRAYGEDDYKEVEREFVSVFNGSYELTDNETGMDYARVEIEGMAFIVGYEVTEGGVNIVVTDEEENTLAEVEVLINGEPVSIEIVADVLGQTFLDAAVSVTETKTDDSYACTINIDIDRLLLASGEMGSNYVEFDGSIKFNVA